MAEKFVNHFSTQKKNRYEVDALQSIVQKDGERLSKFLRRFNHAALRIPEAQQYTTVYVMRQNTNHGDFKYHLHKHKPNTVAQAIADAEKNIDSQDVWKSERYSPRDSKSLKRPR